MIKNVLRTTEVAMSLCAVFLFFSGNAHAYVDAGTGSYFLQIAIGGIAGAAFSLKLFWAQILQAVARRVRPGRRQVKL